MNADYLKKLDLKIFCDRYRLPEPLLASDNYVYVSNAKLAIRFRPWSGNKFKSEEHKARCLNWFHDELIDKPRTPLPDFKIIYNTCSTCDGSGKTKVCDECLGTGYISCFNCSTVTRCTNCIRGLNPGGSEICEDCRGTGKNVVNKFTPVTPYIETETLEVLKLKKLKAVELYIDEIRDNVLPFIFMGGQGLIMTREIDV